MEKMTKIVAFAIIPILLISILPNNAFGHQLNSSDCTDIGLVLRTGGTIGGLCVINLETVCSVDFHGDSIGGGFVNIGTDQFGNDCREVHPSDPDLAGVFDPVTKTFIDLYFDCLNSCAREGVALLIGITLIIVAFPVIIIFLIIRRIRRK